MTLVVEKGEICTLCCVQCNNTKVGVCTFGERVWVMRGLRWAPIIRSKWPFSISQGTHSEPICCNILHSFVWLAFNSTLEGLSSLNLLYLLPWRNPLNVKRKLLQFIGAASFSTRPKVEVVIVKRKHLHEIKYENIFHLNIWRCCSNEYMKICWVNFTKTKHFGSSRQIYRACKSIVSCWQFHYQQDPAQPPHDGSLNFKLPTLLC